MRICAPLSWESGFCDRLPVLKDGFRVVDSQITVRASDESFASLGGCGDTVRVLEYS